MKYITWLWGWYVWLENATTISFHYRSRPTFTPFVVVNDTRWVAIKSLFRAFHAARRTMTIRNCTIYYCSGFVFDPSEHEFRRWCESLEPRWLAHNNLLIPEGWSRWQVEAWKESHPPFS